MGKVIHYANNGRTSWLTCQSYWTTTRQVAEENNLTGGRATYPTTLTDIGRVNCPDCMENIYQLAVSYREMRQLLTQEDKE